MNKSVVSAQARLWHDSWMEAARRAGLPRTVAAGDLAGALASVSAGNRRLAEARLAFFGHLYAGTVIAQAKGRIGHVRRGEQV